MFSKVVWTLGLWTTFKLRGVRLTVGTFRHDGHVTTGNSWVTLVFGLSSLQQENWHYAQGYKVYKECILECWLTTQFGFPGALMLVDAITTPTFLKRFGDGKSENDVEGAYQKCFICPAGRDFWWDTYCSLLETPQVADRSDRSSLSDQDGKENEYADDWRFSRVLQTCTTSLQTTSRAVPNVNKKELLPGVRARLCP